MGQVLKEKEQRHLERITTWTKKFVVWLLASILFEYLLSFMGYFKK